MSSPSLGTALSSRDNSLNAIRLILASAVIVSHTPLGGYAHTDIERIGPLAVNGFFALSGYLIIGSRLRNGFIPYLERRSRRIFPGFWTCLLITAFVFAPIAAFLGSGSWQPHLAISYVMDNALLYAITPGVGDSLAGAPNPLEWNGALWSLWYEFMAYLCFGALLAFGWVRRHLILVAVALSVTLPVLAWWVGDLTGDEHKIEAILRLFSFFAAGMLAYSLRDRLRPSGQMALLCVVFVLAALLYDERFMHLVTAIPLTYLLLYLGATWRTSIAAREDISYGMYIYGWPVQQLLAALGLGAIAPAPVFAIVSVACTAPFAIASWRLVEQPLMRSRRRAAVDLPQTAPTQPTPARVDPEQHALPALVGSR